jgi:glycosyltransferase involved in cell wall biosynthesis
VNDVELVVFGHQSHAQDQHFGYKVHHVGFIQDERLMALLYSALDVFVAPSVEDNLPNTIAEAIACGTPCVAFTIGGIPDMITHRANGFLATPFDVDELAEGIRWVLADDTDWTRLSAHARQKAEDYLELGKVARQYKDLYESILATDRH